MLLISIAWVAPFTIEETIKSLEYGEIYLHHFMYFFGLDGPKRIGDCFTVVKGTL